MWVKIYRSIPRLASTYASDCYETDRVVSGRSGVVQMWSRGFGFRTRTQSLPLSALKATWIARMNLHYSKVPQKTRWKKWSYFLWCNSFIFLQPVCLGMMSLLYAVFVNISALHRVDCKDRKRYVLSAQLWHLWLRYGRCRPMRRHEILNLILSTFEHLLLEGAELLFGIQTHHPPK